MSFDIKVYATTFKNPRYVKNGGILFDTILDGKPQTFLAMAQDHHEHTVEIFNDALNGKWGPIQPYQESVETERKHKISTLEAVSAAIGLAILTAGNKYQPGYDHIATLVLAAGGNIPQAHPSYPAVDTFAKAHNTTVANLSKLVMTLSSIAINNGAALKTATVALMDFKANETQLREALTAFETAANNLINQLKLVCPDAELTPVTIT
jgi:hypothetical protein